MDDYEIKQAVCIFMEALKTDQYKALRDILTDDCSCYLSTWGTAKGRDEVIRCLSWKGKPCELLKQDVTNLIIRYHDRQGIATAHELVLRGVSENGYLHTLQYAGTYVIKFKKTDLWRIDEIRYDLVILKGNTAWIKNMNQIDYSRYFGHEPMINPVYDSPWKAIRRDESNKSEAQKVIEKVYQYGWIIDEQDYPLLAEITSDDFHLYDGYHNKSFANAREWIDYMKYLNYREPCLHHSYRIDEIHIHGSSAEAKVKRLEPDRIGKDCIDLINYKLNWFSLDYVFLLKKKKEWEIQSISFSPNYFTNCIKYKLGED